MTAAPFITIASRIQTLENAPLGTIATSQDHQARLIKMSDSGTPWMRDPWDRGLGAERMTTSYAAQLGYQADPQYGPDDRPELWLEPTPENARARIAALSNLGMTHPEVSDLTGIPLEAVRKSANGTRPLSAERCQTILDITPTVPLDYTLPSLKERFEDLAFLLDVGTPLIAAVRRCGWWDTKAAKNACRRAGSMFLYSRLIGIEGVLEVDEESDDLAA